VQNPALAPWTIAHGSNKERVTEDEIDLFVSAEIGQPVPGEHTLAAG
jgi:hypothetical protein